MSKQVPTCSRVDICIYAIIENSQMKYTYRLTSNISRKLIGNTIVDHLDVVGASHFGVAATTTSLHKDNY